MMRLDASFAERLGPSEWLIAALSTQGNRGVCAPGIGSFLVQRL